MFYTYAMDSILGGFKKALGGLFGKIEDSNSVGIDIGTSSIKVVALRKEGGRAILNTYGALSLGQYKEGGAIGQVVALDAATTAQALMDVLKETNITSKNVVVGIPSVSCIIFILQLPASIDEKTLGTVIPSESKKFIPVALEEVSLDWYVIPRREDSGTASRVLSESGGEAKISVLVVATLNETLAKYSEVLQRAALPMDTLEIEIFSHIRSVLTRELFPVMIIDIGASKTKLTIVEHGIVETFRLINRGSQDMTFSISRSLEMSFARAEEVKKQFGILPSVEHPTVSDTIKTHLIEIFQEANSNILAYEKRYNKNIGKIIFTGGGAMTKGLIDFAKEKLSAELVVADPFSKVESPIFLGQVLKNTGPEFSIALGLALKKFQ